MHMAAGMRIQTAQACGTVGELYLVVCCTAPLQRFLNNSHVAHPWHLEVTVCIESLKHVACMFSAGSVAECFC
jgi:hypothetical protein